MIKKILYYLVINYNLCVFIYRKLYGFRSDEYADYLKKRDYFYSIGNGCRINSGATFTDPKYVKIGNNSCLSACTLIGHDGAIAVFATATKKVLDKVGKIEIGNNCFIGHSALIMPDVTIGNNCIVAAGSVVTKNIESGKIVGGIPAKIIGETKDYINKIEQSTLEYPWYDLLKQRKEVYNKEIEDKLLPIRLSYFFECK